MTQKASGRILVIDDELGIREGCQRALRPQGFLVEKAATVQEGLHKLEGDDFDLVLLDVMLPDGRGIDLLEPIHAQDPDTVCVIITGYATVELAVEAIKQGAYDFISKPFTSDLLLMTVNQGLERRRLSQEAKRLEEVERVAAELARSKQEMEQLNQRKSEFMVMVAHELRSPIGGAQSLLRTLVRGLAGELNQKQKEILGRVEIRLDGLMELVNDLLSLAATKTLEADKPLESVPLCPLLQDMIDRFSVEADSKQLSLSLKVPEKNLSVRATEDGLETVFTNLIGNAIKYTPSGGHVEITVTDYPEIVQIAVADTGIGIPQADLSQLFEEFFRAKNARRSGITGTGLGLSIVKQLVERFGGKIEVQSVEGQGTTFTVALAKST
jgi:two-component system sensor histidine kinase/response regulator